MIFVERPILTITFPQIFVMDSARGSTIKSYMIRSAKFASIRVYSTNCSRVFEELAVEIGEKYLELPQKLWVSTKNHIIIHNIYILLLIAKTPHYTKYIFLVFNE